MTTAAITDKQERIKQWRSKLTNLSENEREVLLSRGIIATIEGRQLSAYNTLFIMIQAGNFQPTVVGGFKQWRVAGRTVKKGEHGFVIWFPVGPKDEDGELVDCERFYTGTVFDISQTEELEKAEPAVAPTLAEAVR